MWLNGKIRQNEKALTLGCNNSLHSVVFFQQLNTLFLIIAKILTKRTPLFITGLKLYFCVYFDESKYFCFQRSIFKAEPILNGNTLVKHKNIYSPFCYLQTCLTFFCETKKEMLSMSELLLFQPKLCSSKNVCES